MTDEEFIKELGKNIDRLRKEKGMSFLEMAYRCDIEKSNLVKLTTQGKNITLKTLHKIVKGLEVSFNQVFDFYRAED